MRLTTAGYGDIVRRLDEVARRLCHRRLSLVTEGGYHLGALADCLSLTIDVLS
jgi:acetoin utilization deacetylase AcuC-like enzyme